MGLGITFNDIPKMSGGLWPEGIWMANIGDAEIRYSAMEKRMIWVNFQGEGDEVEGRQGFENIVLGVLNGDYGGKVTYDDPEANTNAETWKLFGPSKWKELLEAANTVGLDSIDPSDHKSQETLVAGLPGGKVLVEVYNTIQKTGDYKGTEQNNFRFYKIGARKVGPKGKRPMQAAPMSPPSAPVAPVAAPKVEAAPAGEVVMVNCPKCKQDIPSNEFGPHVMSCTGA